MGKAPSAWIAEQSYAVFDTETTGFSPDSGDEIIEISIVRMEADGTRLAEFSTLLNPGRDVGPTHIHRVTDDMVADAPTFNDVKGHVCDLLHNAVVVAHNAQFDRQFLAHALSRSGVAVDRMPMLCTVKLTDELLLDRVENRKLATLAETFELGLDGAHAAYVDTRATASLLAGYLHIAQARGIDDLAAFQRSFIDGFGPAELRLHVDGTAATVNRDGVAALFAEAYPTRPAPASLARFHPPTDPAKAAGWFEVFDRYKAKVSCPKCGALVKQRTRKRDSKPFLACTAWRDSGCDYTVDVDVAAAA